jgi:hypothetical protein
MIYLTGLSIEVPCLNQDLVAVVFFFFVCFYFSIHEAFLMVSPKYCMVTGQNRINVF